LNFKSGVTAIALKKGAFYLGSTLTYGNAKRATGASSDKQITNTKNKGTNLIIMIINVRIG